MPRQQHRYRRIFGGTLLFCASITPAWAASVAQSIPEEAYQNGWRGISLVMHGEVEGVANLSGGIQTGTTATGLWKGGLALHSGKAGWWPGGLFVLEGLAADSANPDSLYIGDLQGVSSLTTPYPHIARLYKAYYRQHIGDYTLRLGLINPNDYFNDTGVASELFNTSFGIYPIISANIPFTPTYPYSSLGVMASASWGHTMLMVGAFGADGVHPFRAPWGSDGMMYYGEIDQSIPIGQGTAMLKAGGYYNHIYGPYLTQNIGIGPSSSQGGFYGAAEYRWKTDQINWGVFVQAGGAPNAATVSPVNAYMGVGLRLRHFIPGSPGSTLSLGMARAWKRQSGSNAGGAETSLEVNFKQPVLKDFYIQPDLQYIVNPGANGPGNTLPNAFVAIIRLGWHYHAYG
ncbi:carbohydrate porin [Acidithiobacillus sp. M4-SHS-6]|uniref:carbohydrate porin n=1 Tax=Acidithiobacillus sp. M4-SHS-6 TaxID=3383024 RepID=UPI0039BE9FFD